MKEINQMEASQRAVVILKIAGHLLKPTVVLKDFSSWEDNQKTLSFLTC
jgi:hypothetical protein